MRRLAVTALILVAAAVAAGAAPGASLVAKPKATVKVKSCSIDERSALFYARMRKLRGTRRMRMRFTLLERAAGRRRFKRARAPGLSRWRKSDRGVRSYGYSQEVRGLHDGSVYRMRVRYRWYDRDGEIQRRARRTSKPCRMFVPLPNLRVRVIEPLATGPRDWHYRALVLNVGKALAESTSVQLTVGGFRDTTPVPPLAPGEAAVVELPGPACEERYAFKVDPVNAVPEANERDNRAVRNC